MVWLLGYYGTLHCYRREHRGRAPQQSIVVECEKDKRHTGLSPKRVWSRVTDRRIVFFVIAAAAYAKPLPPAMRPASVLSVQQRGLAVGTKN